LLGVRLAAIDCAEGGDDDDFTPVATWKAGQRHVGGIVDTF
jgi:hypothetical protein